MLHWKKVNDEPPCSGQRVMVRDTHGTVLMGSWFGEEGLQAISGMEWVAAKAVENLVSLTPVNTHGLDEMEECEYALMLKLRETLELGDTVIPHTILTFANLRVMRYEKELRDAKAALELAHESLLELIPDHETDFGPAYEGVKRRQNEATRAIRKILKHH